MRSSLPAILTTLDALSAQQAGVAQDVLAIADDQGLAYTPAQVARAIQAPGINQAPPPAPAAAIRRKFCTTLEVGLLAMMVGLLAAMAFTSDNDDHVAHITAQEVLDVVGHPVQATQLAQQWPQLKIPKGTTMQALPGGGLQVAGVDGQWLRALDGNLTTHPALKSGLTVRFPALGDGNMLQLLRHFDSHTATRYTVVLHRTLP